ncbi:UDP-N-acetyl-D-galactosamine:polypeptide N-acetylgalactosaminyltransferase T2 [Neospora caninum Liverpool]|uniref:UDP-N-acetyl-D-galactosamine:polypeptide N-acetylgalactosaminyltransferase T2 n=1 Tax=Neospora caninum (strain Liverpool) TaxID=572307 RepID=F0VGZ1_NEOCL|nr:UDP-N-acetyl-D-galactosamine:polypeptide N-acetylgalactosaminyltransferase T2 [Neospora caninum Liverpool]CBZ52985.1 UDP-N-acetyl-D-galactosamine:polypeptide N-acetylgalactosaminyltransferase T2 [Neospora caninum Liverpool]CEL66971.1 TPA: UDP-N-acetyl-D-galactosamine:polypeptide N-acetylgalactosaminyltransferase T2, putative [Neospora caninum Liverpool]|eukprot:XP_003883017.1 UDP-N-acetyl-D-galactosamine:polypeptide N-acetylgalactosaminyltransferase T2 [Neospora caninum Liverpool]
MPMSPPVPGAGDPAPSPWPSRGTSWRSAEMKAEKRSLNPKLVARLRRRCLLLLGSLCVSAGAFWCLFSSGVLTALFPSAFSRDPSHTHSLDFNSPPVAQLHGLLKGLPLPRHHEKTTVDNSAVVVGVHGTVKAPYSRVIDHLLKIVTLPTLTGEPRYVTGDDFSIIIPVRNEEAYLPKTLTYLFEVTPPERIREVIVVDDNSDRPIKAVLEKALPQYMLNKTRFIRFDSYQGLIRGRVAGAAIATSDNLFFLDGHCRPKLGWAEPLLAHLKINYRRVACPKIYDIFPDSWEDVGTHGTKMMFEWTFEFGWFEDQEDEVPVLSGGILAMTKKWWFESGLYDEGMLEWGGENLEQSIRSWLCGGEIVAVQESKIGHIFSRPPKPNPGNRLVIQVQKNQKRAAKVWLDEYYNLFYKYHREVRGHQEGDVTKRKKLRYEELTCMPFQWYVEKFKTAFDRNGLLDHNYFHIQHEQTGLCLSSAYISGFPEHRLVLEPCNLHARLQQWTLAGGNRLIANREKKCIDAYSQLASTRSPLTWKCDWNRVLQNQNSNEFWQWDASLPGQQGVSANATGRIFSFSHPDTVSLTGHDTLPVYRHMAVSHQAKCLVADDSAETNGKPLVHWKSCDEPVRAESPQTESKEAAGDSQETRAKNEKRADVVDRMRFKPKWVYAPLSSRFGVRTMETANAVTDEAAEKYIRKAPKPLDE